MSADNNNATDDTPCCASCGIAEVDEIKLKKCNGCYLIRYCSVECQRDHWPQHKQACKKQAVELRDELLFKQPESSHLGDCPICCLPLPLELQKSTMNSCCSKFICNGCYHAYAIREMEMRLGNSCPFCREPAPSNDEEGDKRRMKRVEANNPVALCHEGVEQYRKGDNTKAFEYYQKAAELGDVEAHYKLAILYKRGLVAEKDIRKEIHHLEEAAIGGHPSARFLLGREELLNNLNAERAVKHWIISASQGQNQSIKALMDAFKGGFISKEVLETTIRAHQAALDATKSPQREAVEKSREEYDNQKRVK